MPRRKANTMEDSVTQPRLETIITDMPHGRGMVKVVRNLETGEQVSREVIEENFQEQRIPCPHCGKYLIIPTSQHMIIDDDELDNDDNPL